MSIPYRNIVSAVALRAGQLVGGDQAAREALYDNPLPWTGTELDGTELPYTALKRDILAIEKELAAKIAATTISPFRAHLAGRSDNLLSGALIPAVDDFNQSFLGVFDGVFDQDDNLPLTEMPKQVTLRRVDNPGGFWLIPRYHYSIEGTRIFHTRTGAYFRGCSWDYDVQVAAFDADGNSPLPQELESLWVCKVLAQLPQEDWFAVEGSYYRDLAAQKEANIIEGKVRTFALPQMPTATARVDATKD